VVDATFAVIVTFRPYAIEGVLSCRCNDDRSFRDRQRTVLNYLDVIRKVSLPMRQEQLCIGPGQR